MTNNEYRDNQRIQKKEFKKYRKAMSKVLFGFILAIVAAFILPETILPTFNTFLKGFFSSYIAGSITVFTQIGLTVIGALTGLVNAFKANKARTKLDEAQEKEEDSVDQIFNKIESLTNDNTNLKAKVASLQKQLKEADTKDHEDVLRIFNKLRSEVNKNKNINANDIKRIVQELEDNLSLDYVDETDFRLNIPEENEEDVKHYKK
jgi:gas vesicle protein